MYALVYFALLFLTHANAEMEYQKEGMVGMVNYTRKDMCRNEDTLMLGTSMKEIRCQPRPTLVLIDLMDHRLLTLPPAVMVMRCGGYCISGKTCMATKTRVIQKPIQSLDFLNNGKECGIAYVEEHLSCSCRCKIKPQDCTEHQYYHKSCMCLCANMAEMRECQSKSGRYWNHKTCECECANTTPCTTGFVWIPSLCSCGKVTMMEETSDGNELERDVMSWD